MLRSGGCGGETGRSCSGVTEELRSPGTLQMGCGEQTLFISAQVACRWLVTACCASLVSHS